MKRRIRDEWRAICAASDESELTNRANRGAGEATAGSRCCGASEDPPLGGGRALALRGRVAVGMVTFVRAGDRKGARPVLAAQYNSTRHRETS
jgi:hypothetical protein